MKTRIIMQIMLGMNAMKSTGATLLSARVRGGDVRMGNPPWGSMVVKVRLGTIIALFVDSVK